LLLGEQEKQPPLRSSSKWSSGWETRRRSGHLGCQPGPWRQGPPEPFQLQVQPRLDEERDTSGSLVQGNGGATSNVALTV